VWEVKMLLLGMVCLTVCGGAVALGALLGALLLGRGRRSLSPVLIVIGVAGLCWAAPACVATGFYIITGQGTVSEAGPTPAATVVAQQDTATETPRLAETPSGIVLSPEEILRRGAQAMRGVSSAHIIFAQEDVGNYAASGEGVLLSPDRAHVQRKSSFDKAPVETIVIGSTGYWVDESVSGGWNSGPVAPFASNPARWVELLQFANDPALLGEERINGVDCYHVEFAATIEPGWLGLFSGGGTGEAWVSRADYSLVKAIYDLQYEGARESATMHLALELSELNEPVSIEPPR
jgi:hypothetical protein